MDLSSPDFKAESKHLGEVASCPSVHHPGRAVLRNTFQTRERDKTPEKRLNETEISDLPNIEFKQNLIRILTDIGRRPDEHSELINKELLRVDNTLGYVGERGELEGMNTGRVLRRVLKPQVQFELESQEDFCLFSW